MQRVYAEINLSKLEENIKNIKSHVGNRKIIAVVKCDAYGHGAYEVANTIKNYIDILGVASIDEAMELKSIGLPILILSPTYPEKEIIEYNFIPTINYYPFVYELNKLARKMNKKVKIHIEVDTGMSRTGVPYNSVKEYISKIYKLENIEIDGIWTHLSDCEDEEFSNYQIKMFNNILASINNKMPLSHIASSGALLNFNNSYFDAVRPGILIYGLYPSTNSKKSIKVNPILSLYTSVCEIREIKDGTPVSYNRTYIARNKRKIATILVGYGDGYPRSLSNKGYVLIHNKKAPIVGLVCMDLTMVDVSDIPSVKVCDKVTLISNELPVEKLAELAETTNYEIIARIGSRVKRIYVK